MGSANLLEKEIIRKIERISNYEEPTINYSNKRYSFDSGRKMYLTPKKLVDESNSYIDSFNKEFMKLFTQYDESCQLFFEECNVIEKVVIGDEDDEKRHWEYLRAGIITPDHSIHTISKPIMNAIDVKDFISEFKIICDITNKPISALDLNINQDTIFYFEPQATAYIAHEFLGHSFEEDYYNMFTCNMFANKDTIECSRDFMFTEINEIDNYILRHKDDCGEIQESEKVIFDSGVVVNVINGKRVNESNGMLQCRMSGTKLIGKGKDKKYEFENWIHVYSISQGYVDFINKKVVLITDLAEYVQGNRIRRIDRLALEMDYLEIFANFIEIGNVVQNYQNYCIKEQEVVDVFSSAPYAILKGFKSACLY